MVTIPVAKAKQLFVGLCNNIDEHRHTINLTRFTGGIHAGRTTNQEYGYSRTWQQW